MILKFLHYDSFVLWIVFAFVALANCVSFTHVYLIDEKWKICSSLCLSNSRFGCFNETYLNALIVFD